MSQARAFLPQSFSSAAGIPVSAQQTLNEGGEAQPSGRKHPNLWRHLHGEVIGEERASRWGAHSLSAPEKAHSRKGQL